MIRLTRWSSLSGAERPTRDSTQSMPSTIGGRAGLGARRQPPAGILEDDDVAALVAAESRGDLVDEDPVVDEEGVLHRTRRDVERPDQEGLDEERDEHRDEDDDEHVAQEREPARADAAEMVGLRAGARTGPALRGRSSRSSCGILRRARRRSECRHPRVAHSGPHGRTRRRTRTPRTTKPRTARSGAVGQRGDQLSRFSLILAFLPRRLRR